MKWMFLAAVSVAATVLGIAFTTAQQPALKPSPVASKVGVVDLGLVFRKYHNNGYERRGLDPELRPLKDQEEQLRSLIAQWQSALARSDSPLTAEQQGQGAKSIKECNRRLAELGEEYRKRSKKIHENYLIKPYQDLENAIRSIATTQGYDLVLGFGEPAEGDLPSSMNATRKVDAMLRGEYVPIYFADDLDISRQVVEILNKSDGSPTGSARSLSATKVGVVNVELLIQNKLSQAAIDFLRSISSNVDLPCYATAEETEREKRTLKEREQRLRGLEIRPPGKGKVSIENIYKEINDAVRSYAIAQGFHLILGRGDSIGGRQPTDKDLVGDAYTMKLGGVVPTYFAGALDISTPVLEMLSRKAPRE